MAFSTHRDLRNIIDLSPMPDTIGILLTNPLTITDATELANALETLAKKVDIPNLSLLLSCRCSQESGKIVTNGLQPFKGLKKIALVLNSRPGPASKVAREVARSLSGEELPAIRVPFTILPREIRHRIIDYVFDDGFQQVDIWQGRYNKDTWCCKTCMPRSLVSTKHCACSQRVGGFSDSCQCVVTEYALFRVNKLLYEDSTFVCFSTTRFRIQDLKLTLKFFSSLPEDALRAMRKIDLRIKAYEYHSFVPKPPEEFVKVIDIILAKCNISQLHLSIDMADQEVELGHFPEDDPPQTEKVQENIANALKPLKNLKRLDLYLSMVGPEDEDRLEKSVMGEDYNAIALGKLHMFLRDSMAVHYLYETPTD